MTPIFCFQQTYTPPTPLFHIHMKLNKYCSKHFGPLIVIFSSIWTRGKRKKGRLGTVQKGLSCSEAICSYSFSDKKQCCWTIACKWCEMTICIIEKLGCSDCAKAHLKMSMLTRHSTWSENGLVCRRYEWTWIIPHCYRGFAIANSPEARVELSYTAYASMCTHQPRGHLTPTICFFFVV